MATINDLLNRKKFEPKKSRSWDYLKDVEETQNNAENNSKPLVNDKETIGKQKENNSETISKPSVNDKETVGKQKENNSETISKPSVNDKETVGKQKENNSETISKPSVNDKETVGKQKENNSETISKPSVNDKETVGKQKENNSETISKPSVNDKETVGKQKENNSETISEPSVNDKETVGKQKENNSETISKSSVNDKETISKQNPDKIDSNYSITEAKAAITNLSGIQKKIFKFIVSELNSNLETDIITSEKLLEIAGCNTDTLKVLIGRLYKKGLVVKSHCKTGKGGFRKFKLSKVILRAFEESEQIPESYFGKQHDKKLPIYNSNTTNTINKYSNDTTEQKPTTPQNDQLIDLIKKQNDQFQQQITELQKQFLQQAPQVQPEIKTATVTESSETNTQETDNEGRIRDLWVNQL